VDSNDVKQAVLAQAQQSDRNLQLVYDRLRARLSPSARAQLKEEQRNWLKLRDAQIGTDELLSQGMRADADLLRRFADLTDHRAADLRARLESMR
jgi:uncharacterized protein YecT (DUF1311 family)